MMTANITATIFIISIYGLTGAWIGSLDKDDTVPEMLWSGLSYGAVGMAVVIAENLLLT